MSIVVDMNSISYAAAQDGNLSDVNNISDMATEDENLSESSTPSTQDENMYERLKNVAQDGDIERLYQLIAGDPNMLEHFDNVRFCETPLHVAAANGHTHFAMELMTLKPSLALKLDLSGLSPMHLALQNNHTQMVRGFIAMDSSLISIKGRGRFTPLHHVAKIGDAQLLSEFLLACPSSIEDLTIKCETAVHIAVKNNHMETFKVLLGWVRRANIDEILNWKDEDGNTAFHIAASINQTEVMKLLGKTVKIKAKNLDGKTAMEILQMHQSPLCPTARSLFHTAKEGLFGSTVSLVRYFSNKPSWIEKWYNRLGLSNLPKSKHRSRNSSDRRSVILVVAILIVTTTYQGNLSPPGGFSEDYAGKMTIPSWNAIIFHIFNGYAFFSALYVIVILIVGLPMWKVLFGSTVAMGVANWASFFATIPDPACSVDRHLQLIFLWGYPLTSVVIVFAAFVIFTLNKHCRRQVDFPARYFTSPHELS